MTFIHPDWFGLEIYMVKATNGELVLEFLVADWGEGGRERHIVPPLLDVRIIMW